MDRIGARTRAPIRAFPNCWPRKPNPSGALWGFRDKAELLANEAQALIARPEELLSLLA